MHAVIRAPRRLLRTFCWCGVAWISLAACNGGGGTPITRLAADQTLKFPILADFGTLDPGVLVSETDAQIARNLFNGLVKYDNNLKVVPDIASAMPAISQDGLTYTFTLRNDVTFSNGDKVSAKDILYSWNRAAAMQGVFATNLSAIAGYETVSGTVASGAELEKLLDKNDPSVTMSGLTAPDGPDGYKVQVKLASPAGWFVSAIALPASVAMLVDQKIVKSNFDKWWTQPETLVGTGPFRMTSRIPNSSVDFEAVASWWGSPKSTLTKVHLDIVAGASSAISQYEQGAYDIYGYGGYSNAPVDEVRRIQGISSEKSQLRSQVRARTTWVSFNMVSDASRKAKGPFTLDGGSTAHDLRMAFALAIDKTKLASVVCQSACTPATGGLIPKGLSGYLGDGADALAAFDATKARALLRSADPTGTKTQGLTYTYNPEDPINAATATFLQTQWHDNLGIQVATQPVPQSQFLAARLSGNYVLSRDVWKADYNNPQDWFDYLWGKLAGCPDSTCASGYDTVAYDKLLAKADGEQPPQALPDYVALSQMLVGDVAYIPLYYSVGVFLFKPYVRGAGANDLFDFDWNQVQLLAH
jgi:oligopeptide transport system substrate-binding protein